jgi:hypothetical protein
MRWFAVLLVLLLPALALAQAGPPEPKKAEVAPDTENNLPVSTLLQLKGPHLGIWFPMAGARDLLEKRKLLPIKEKELEKTEGLLKLKEERIGILEANVKTSEEIADAWKGTAEQQAKALAQDNPWWRSPYLWMAVGFAAGVATTVGVTVAIKRSGAVE